MFNYTTFALLGLASSVLAKVQFLGVAIAGGDFGCQIDGSCPLGSVQLPLDQGPAQMQHFVEDDGMNMMRLPTSWQFLVNDQLGGDLDAANAAQYDQLVQACLATGAHCIIDLHNFARWDGAVIGQDADGPSDAQFAALWGQIAAKYAGDERVVFELMNEPHDLDVGAWAQTCQTAVTAIRDAGAASQMILLPGSNFDSAASLTTDGSADALLAVTNPDGGTSALLLDVHKYLDADNSGTHAECVTDNVAALGTLADYLRARGRRGLVSETGASSDASCMTDFCAQNTFINANADVFAGLVAWAAGSFDSSYVLSLTPSSSSSSSSGLVDNQLLSQCVLAPWAASADDDDSSSSSSSASSSILPSPSSSSASASATTFSSATTTKTTAAATAATDSGSGSNPVVGTSTMYLPMSLASGSSSGPSTLAVATGTPVAANSGLLPTTTTTSTGGSGLAGAGATTVVQDSGAGCRVVGGGEVPWGGWAAATAAAVALVLLI
ncbi:endoglucanase 2 [Xylariaceae sp. FL0804]|nr:endoglucanase 2 [Xylariaceae sp. FL0804]